MLLLIIIYIPDTYIYWLVKPSIQINIDINLLDSDDSDDELLNTEHSSLKKYENYLLFW